MQSYRHSCTRACHRPPNLPICSPYRPRTVIVNHPPKKKTWIFKQALHGVNPTRQLFYNVPTRLNPTRQLLFLFAPWAVLRFYGRCRNIPTRFLERNVARQPNMKLPHLQHSRTKIPGLILACPAMHARVSTIHSISKYQVNTIYALMCAPFGGT